MNHAVNLMNHQEVAGPRSLVNDTGFFSQPSNNHRNWLQVALGQFQRAQGTLGIKTCRHFNVKNCSKKNGAVNCSTSRAVFQSLRLVTSSASLVPLCAQIHGPKCYDCEGHLFWSDLYKITIKLQISEVIRFLRLLVVTSPVKKEEEKKKKKKKKKSSVFIENCMYLALQWQWREHVQSFSHQIPPKFEVWL